MSEEKSWPTPLSLDATNPRKSITIDESYEQPVTVQDLRKRFSVKVTGSNKRVIVLAEYYRIDDHTGVLTFRNTNEGTYPSTVQAFAPGYWLDIKVEDAP